MSHLQDIPAQPQIEDDATLDLMMYGLTTLKPQVNLPDAPETSGACGLPENEAEELAGHCEGAQGDLESKDAGILEHPKVLWGLWEKMGIFFFFLDTSLSLGSHKHGVLGPYGTHSASHKF
ncbi:hypothetical protein lerEdw1_018315 [Lerista edwardsae]|nr:hypothetical protein lerEdw1_018315 [Lerista edwardsae]